MSAKIPSVHEPSARPDAAYAPAVDTPTKPREAGESFREWRPAPGGLVSLWDMLRVHAETFLLLMKAFARLEPHAEALIQRLNQTSSEGPPPQKTEAARQGLSLFLEAVERNCQELELTSGLDQVPRLRKMLEAKPVPEAFRAGVKELENRVEDELKRRTFFSIPHKSVRILEQEHPFGKKVQDKFPKQAEDIAEASKCMAFDRYTAAVFHLMRVMERAVHFLAHKLGIKGWTIEEKPWGTILDQIDKALDAEDARIQVMSSAAGPRTPANRLAWAQVKRAKRKLATHRETAAYLHHVKDAWRNDTMHPKRTYTQAESEEVFRSARSFVRSLAGAKDTDD